MNEEQAKKLRAPFPPGEIGKLPKAGLQLDYVGHAAVTNRLLEVDPEWTWEPAAVDQYGTPIFDKSGGLWIRLTVAGVTRLGYGNGQGPDAVKIAIGDALRNAAMRFGVALDLWSKEELSHDYDPAMEAAREADGYDPNKVTRTNQPDPDDPWATTPPQTFDQTDSMKRQGEWSGKGDPTKPATQKQIGLVAVKFRDKGITERADILAGINTILGRQLTSSSQLTNGDIDPILEGIKALPEPAVLGDWQD